MKPGKRIVIRTFVAFVLLIGASFAGLVVAMPGAATCAFLEQTSLVLWSDSKYAESTDEMDHKRYEALLTQARSRISRTFGDSTSNPHIVFFNSTQPFIFYQPNLYGSTQFFGNKVCVFIGPEGQNIDVVSHELVHADIFSILGAIDRTLHLPVWLDEGIAMQVDHRPEYVLENPDFRKLSEVNSWNTYREFFDASADGELANRYALAKTRAAGWVEATGTEPLYTILKGLVSGGMSEESLNAGLLNP